jgi:hypothetical protein
MVSVWSQVVGPWVNRNDLQRTDREFGGGGCIAAPAGSHNPFLRKEELETLSTSEGYGFISERVLSRVF